MTNIERRDAGLAYISDKNVFEEQLVCRKILQKLNFIDRSDFDGIGKIVTELLGKSDGAFINPPFYCDYGCNTTVGENFYCNYDCVFLDCGKITIGDHVMLGPKVSIYTANHPIDPAVRSLGHDHGIPVTIGNHVWIGGNSVICPGVTIGDNAVIGAGSVVTKDIPANVVAAGNPCRVIRPITQADTDYWNDQLALYRKLCDNPQV